MKFCFDFANFLKNNQNLILARKKTVKAATASAAVAAAVAAAAAAAAASALLPSCGNSGYLFYLEVGTNLGDKKFRLG